MGTLIGFYIFLAALLLSLRGIEHLSFTRRERRQLANLNLHRAFTLQLRQKLDSRRCDVAA
jgi:hypothetical protein